MAIKLMNFCMAHSLIVIRGGRKGGLRTNTWKQASERERSRIRLLTKWASGKRRKERANNKIHLLPLLLASLTCPTICSGAPISSFSALKESEWVQKCGKQTASFLLATE